MKMYVENCPVCHVQIRQHNNYLRNTEVFRGCRGNKKSRKIKKGRFARTSTPVSDYDYNPSPSFSDSVTEFFYQSWKSGLHSDSTQSQEQFCCCGNQNQAVQEPVYTSPQIVYVNTVIYQPYMPSMGMYMQTVGYRPDGTYGVIPIYWVYPGN